MNWKKAVLTTGLAMTTALMIVACGKETKNNEQINPYTAYGCPAGAYYSGGYCYDANGQVVGGQGNFNNNGFGGPNINLIADNYQYRNLRIKNGGVYKDFLRKALHVCDQGTGSNGGLAGCSSWLSGYAQLVIQTPATQSQSLRLVFSAYPYSNQNYSYSYQLPSVRDFFSGLAGLPQIDSWRRAGATRNPLSLDLIVSAVNKSQGFEARGYGDTYTQANRSLVQFIVTTGKLEDAQIDFELAFEGKVFATGKAARY